MLLTAKTQKQDLVEGMEAGADDFLTKPFDREELRVRLRAGERIIRLEQTLRDDAKVALIETEKLASLGRLAAGVSHEINNPLSIVVNNLARAPPGRAGRLARAGQVPLKEARASLGRSRNSPLRWLVSRRRSTCRTCTSTFPNCSPARRMG